MEKDIVLEENCVVKILKDKSAFYFYTFKFLAKQSNMDLCLKRGFRAVPKMPEFRILNQDIFSKEDIDSVFSESRQKKDCRGLKRYKLKYRIIEDNSLGWGMSTAEVLSKEEILLD